MKKLVTDELWAAIEPQLPERSKGCGIKAGGGGLLWTTERR